MESHFICENPHQLEERSGDYHQSTSGIEVICGMTGTRLQNEISQSSGLEQCRDKLAIAGHVSQETSELVLRHKRWLSHFIFSPLAKPRNCIALGKPDSSIGNNKNVGGSRKHNADSSQFFNIIPANPNFLVDFLVEVLLHAGAAGNHQPIALDASSNQIYGPVSGSPSK